MVVTDEFYQTYKEELTLILLKLFQKAEEATLPKTFYEATITIIRKPEDTTKKENYSPIIFDEYRCKILRKYYQSETNSTLKRSYIMTK